MKNYQLWGFDFLSTNTDPSTNIINGKKCETDEEVLIPCFDGFSFFSFNGKYYIAKYPKIRKLNSYQKDVIEDYCGYTPQAGEYGVIMGALGIIMECDEASYRLYSLTSFYMKKRDIRELYKSWEPYLLGK